MRPSPLGPPSRAGARKADVTLGSPAEGDPELATAQAASSSASFSVGWTSIMRVLHVSVLPVPRVSR